jgi:trigger factor
MSSNFKKISGSRVSFSLKIEQNDLEHAQKNVLNDARKEVAIKGFRKGQAPDDILIKHVGTERIAFDAFNKAVDKKYQSFISENNLQPVSAPKTDFSDMKKMPVKIQLEVEIFPEVILGNYKKIKMAPLSVNAEEKEIDEAITHFMKEMKLGKKVDRKAKNGDLLEVDFLGKNEKGEVIPNTKGEKVSFVLGSGQFLPDLEKAYQGMKSGEKKVAKVLFPKNYPAKEMAGKKVPFDIVLHDVQELSASNLNESTIQKITGKKKSVQNFRKDIAQMVERQKRDQEKQKKVEEYNKKLLKTVTCELPQSWIEKEVNVRMNEVRNHPQFKHDPENFWKQLGKKEADFKKDISLRAEKDLQIFLTLSEIIKQENIELDKDELKKAQLLAHNRVSKNGDSGGVDMEEELQKTILHMRIDKYMEGLML